MPVLVTGGTGFVGAWTAQAGQDAGQIAVYTQAR